MKIHLNELTEIQTGYPFRGAIIPRTDGGGTAVIQMSDLGDLLSPRLDQLCRVELDRIRPGHLIEEDDVIFRSRGNSPSGFWIREVFGPCVVAAPLLRIRAKSNVLHPGYLAWFLRQPAAQSHFELNSQGSSLRMVGKEALESLFVPIIPIDLQRKIAELVELIELENSLVQRLLSLRNASINRILNHRIGEGNHDK